MICAACQAATKFERRPTSIISQLEIGFSQNEPGWVSFVGNSDGIVYEDVEAALLLPDLFEQGSNLIVGWRGQTLTAMPLPPRRSILACGLAHCAGQRVGTRGDRTSSDVTVPPCRPRAPELSPCPCRGWLLSPPATLPVSEPICLPRHRAFSNQNPLYTRHLQVNRC